MNDHAVFQNHEVSHNLLNVVAVVIQSVSRHSPNVFEYFLSFLTHWSCCVNQICQEVRLFSFLISCIPQVMWMQFFIVHTTV